MKSVTIDANGNLPLPTLTRRELGDKSLQLLSTSPGHLLVTASGEKVPVLLAGRLGDLSVADLVSFFNMFRRTGQLHFDLTGGSKDLWFQDGEIIFATSTFPEEDLGEVLTATGRLSAERLKECRRLVGPKKALPKILVEKKLIEKQDVWVAARQQAELIVYNLFGESEGSFYYRELQPEGNERLRLSMSTQNLIMEGLRRMDERTLFLRRIPSLEARVQVEDVDEARLAQLPEEMTNLYLRASQSPMVVRDLIRYSGLGEFEGLRVIYQLVEKRIFSIELPEDASPEGDLDLILEIFNHTLAAIYQRVSQKHKNFRQEVAEFLRDIPQPYSFVLRDVKLKKDGSLDGTKIQANLQGLTEKDQRGLLADALNELLYMECMTAQQILGAEQAQGFILRIQEITRRIREIIGRSA